MSTAKQLIDSVVSGESPDSVLSEVIPGELKATTADVFRNAVDHYSKRNHVEPKILSGTIEYRMGSKVIGVVDPTKGTWLFSKDMLDDLDIDGNPDHEKGDGFSGMY